MDLRQLEVLNAVVQAGSFAGASRRLNVAQSALSRSISMLEDELGQDVLLRLHRRLEPTPAGTIMLDCSRRVFADLRATVETLKEENIQGTLRLGMDSSWSVASAVFPMLIKELRARYPQLEVTVHPDVDGTTRLHQGALDLALMTLPIASNSLLSVPVLREELLLVTSPSHPLAMLKRIAVAELKGQVWIFPTRGSIVRRTLDAFMTRERLEPSGITEVDNIEFTKAFVSAGLGISIMPWTAVVGDVQHRTLFCSRIAGVAIERQMGWVYHKTERVPRAVSETLKVFDELRKDYVAAAQIEPANTRNKAKKKNAHKRARDAT
jgi:DNA-binding transcriptional LysR family regulator